MKPTLAVADATAQAAGVDPLQSWWMPFTHNRRFKAKPRLIESAAGAYYTLTDNGRVFDCLSGLW
ncbi:MAG: aspartate aminotransferase family protein, partial [Steroidobacteraceae bacterium]